MTDKVVSFDINAAQLVSTTPTRPAIEVRPIPPRHTSKALGVAQLASAYTALIGAQATAADLLEQIEIAAQQGQTAPGLTEVAQALKLSGINARVEKMPRLRDDVWPALALMTNGQIILVLAQSATAVAIYDASAADKRTEVSLNEFAGVYAGKVLRAKLTVSDLARRHTDRAKPPHWFWGEFRTLPPPVVRGGRRVCRGQSSGGIGGAVFLAGL